MRIATVQCPVIPDDAGAVRAFVIDHLRWADRAAIDLLLLPEAFLLGHAYDPDTIRKRAMATTRHALADLCRSIADASATLVIGAFEQQGVDIYNTAIVVDRGHVVGRYAKAHPNEPGVTAGVSFPTFVQSDVRYGMNICNDANHPDIAQRIARQGAHLILYPLNNLLPPETADRWREKSIANLVARARETGCWVASADVTGRHGGLVSHGCSAIIAPDGQIVARIPEYTVGPAVYEIPSLHRSTPAPIFAR